MQGFILLLPFLLIRFGLLSVIDKKSVARAAYFPPRRGGENGAYCLYQLSTVAILASLFFLKIKNIPAWWFFAALLIYGIGVLLLIASVVNFGTPAKNGINLNGLYRFSRNPMYVAYFMYFTGCAALTQSLPLLGFLLLFQVAAHWVILSEERWCVEKFGDAYRAYMKKVRRYL